MGENKKVAKNVRSRPLKKKHKFYSKKYPQKTTKTHSLLSPSHWSSRTLRIYVPKRTPTARSHSTIIPSKSREARTKGEHSLWNADSMRVTVCIYRTVLHSVREARAKEEDKGNNYGRLHLREVVEVKKLSGRLIYDSFFGVSKTCQELQTSFSQIDFGDFFP